MSLKKFARAKDQVSADLNGEAAILGLSNGVYYGLNETGARLWDFLSKPRTAGELCDLMTEEYGVEKSRCERDVTALLKQMDKEGLVEIRIEPPA